MFKNLLPATGAMQWQNCDEFGHIHIYGPSSSSQSHAVLENSASQKEQNGKTCHAGQLISTFSSLPARVFELSALVFQTSFEIVSCLENRFADPDLEPPRKPPRFV